RGDRIQEPVRETARQAADVYSAPRSGGVGRERTAAQFGRGVDRVIQQHADAARNMPRVVALRMRNGSMKNYNYLVVDPSGLRAVIVGPAREIEKIDRAVADTQATFERCLGYPFTSRSRPTGQTAGGEVRLSDKESFAAFRLRRRQDIARMFSFSQTPVQEVKANH